MIKAEAAIMSQNTACQNKIELTTTITRNIAKANGRDFDPTASSKPRNKQGEQATDNFSQKKAP